MRLRITIAALAIWMVGCAHFVPDRAHGFVAEQTASQRYFVYLPAAWRADDHKMWPVIVYLHGGGERGSDNVAQTQAGLGPFVYRENGQFPFIVIFPQCPNGHFWAEPAMESRVYSALDQTIAGYHGDASRVYLTGNSMGGYGTWIFGARHPEKFAALAPIAGGVTAPAGFPVPPEAKNDPIFSASDPNAAAARAIGKTPVWAFHGASDWMVSPNMSRGLVAALKAAGGDVRYTEYPHVGHESENRAYADPTLFDWFLQHHL